MENSKNFYQEFLGQIAVIKRNYEGSNEKPTLLLHACCCPCSSHCIEVLQEYFDITIFFYNPNIDDEEEYKKRFAELERFVRECDFAKDVQLLDGGFDPTPFFEMAKGYEDEPERGARCYRCYELRLAKTVECADRMGYDFYTTTLSISPYKNAEWLNEIGARLENDSTFLFSDFKKKNGYKRSIELSEEYHLYRQDYCGCIYSKRDRDRKREESQKREEAQGKDGGR